MHAFKYSPQGMVEQLMGHVSVIKAVVPRVDKCALAVGRVGVEHPRAYV